MIGITKAKFKVLDGKNTLLNTKAVIGSDGIPCLFNPSEFTINRSVNYAQHKIPGLDRPLLQFINGEAEIMSFSLIFDTFSPGEEAMNKFAAASTIAPDLAKADVRQFTQPLMTIAQIDESTHAPNLVEFVWGTISFKGYIQSVSQRFTMFNSRGVPVRATVDISLISDKKDNNIRNSPDRTKARTISEGDRLYAFAYTEYGDCGEWRRIAEANGIDNPRKPEAGERIVIPPILE